MSKNEKSSATALNEESLSLLGLSEGTSQEQVQEAILQLKNKSESLEKANYLALIENAIEDEMIRPESRDFFLDLAVEKGYLFLSQLLGQIVRGRHWDELSPEEQKRSLDEALEECTPKVKIIHIY